MNLLQFALTLVFIGVFALAVEWAVMVFFGWLNRPRYPVIIRYDRYQWDDD